jgi:hypothetical protein
MNFRGLQSRVDTNVRERAVGFFRVYFFLGMRPSKNKICLHMNAPICGDLRNLDIRTPNGARCSIDPQSPHPRPFLEFYPSIAETVRLGKRGITYRNPIPISIRIELLLRKAESPGIGRLA